MEERKVVDYFVVAGLPHKMEVADEFSKDGTNLKPTHNQAPITDITVIIPALGERVPEGYTVIDKTPAGLSADLNHGSLRSPEVFLCYRRGRDKPPLVDVGVMYEGKEKILPDSETVATTPSGKPANVNNSTTKTLLTFRRAPPNMPCNALVVTDIVVIITSKGETAPHAFCTIRKNLNKGLVGSDVYLCYKKSMNRANLITYKPGMLLRYPFENHSNLPLPDTVPRFCLPMGCTLERWPVTAQQPLPIFSTFVLTVSDAAEKLYGSAITFYETYSVSKLNEDQKAALRPTLEERDTEWTYNINKCICLLSRWPFFDTFERFLMFLHEMVRDPSPHPVPVERFISYLFEDVPFPSPQRPRILLQLSPTDRVILTQPEDLPLPRSGASFRQLLMNLGPDNCLLLLLYALTEQKILVHSLRPDELTAVAEAVSMIMFPFKWQCPYIPLCPLGLAEVLHAPLPFLIGVDSRFFDLYDPPSDVNCVDLDTNNITVCEEKRHLNVKFLPKKAGRCLKMSLEKLFKKLMDFFTHSNQVISVTNPEPEDIIEREFQLKRKEQSLELEIQEAFLKFMASVLKGYRNFLLPITKAPTVGTTDTNSLFDLQGFLRSRDRTHLKFYALLTRTQMFIRFIEERSFVSDMDASLAFFDECTEKVEYEDESTRLLEVEESHYSERTMFLMPPEPIGLPPGQCYSYKEFNLTRALFTYDESKNNLHAAKMKNLASRLSGSGLAPGSPMARRTKHEIKVAQRFARKYANSPITWAKCLLGTCYSIWFIHLPSYVSMSPNKAPTTLSYAYDILVRVHKSNLIPADEVCYRVMMQLCGLYSQPVVAVKLLFHMKRSGIQPNAITYGFYNRAVLEATWPSGMSNSSQLLWNKLRNVIVGAALFKRAGIDASKRRHSTINEDNISSADPSFDGESRTSVDSIESSNQAKYHQDYSSRTCSSRFEVFDKFRSRGSIVRPSGLPLLTPSSSFKQQPLESSAGLLMTGSGAPLIEEDLEIGNLDVVLSPNGGPANGKRRNRSGSCSEFTQNHLRHTPTSPKTTNEHCFNILTRSESFANDAGILAKLNTLKMEQMNDICDSSKLKSKRYIGVGQMGQPYSKVLWARRGSLNLSHCKEGPGSESCESSTENLGSSIGSFGVGSSDDIDNINSPIRNRIANCIKGGEGELNGRHSTSELSSLKPGSEENLMNGSPLKSPSRTPVTENDPLGALSIEESEPKEERKTVSRVSSEIELDDSGAPVLFERRSEEWSGGSGIVGVVRSATFATHQDDLVEQECKEESFDPSRVGQSPKGITLHRSSTMPVDVGEPSSNYHGTLASIGSSFKLPFTRYSPGRFSLRKAADIRINAQIIENAISNFSPSSLTAKKSELLMGGLSSLKSAATTMAKKFDEIKEAISANSTPIKAGSLKGSSDKDMWSYPDDECELGDDGLSYRRKVSCELPSLSMYQHVDSWGSNLFGEGSRKGSTTNLGDIGQWSSQPCIVFPKSQRDSSVPVAIQVVMTSCSKCHNCSSILYDEEIMAGWVPEDSNLNTKCQFCDKATVPLLCVSVIDYRNSPIPAPSQENLRERKLSSISIGTSRTSISEMSGDILTDIGEIDKSDPMRCDPITVPYLNPLVLRKEFESILATEGDSCLTQSRFVDEHPIIYWNMVWVFTRIGLDSHLPGLSLGASCAMKNPHPTWTSADSSNVLVSTMWYNPRLHEEVGQPMFMLWTENNAPSSLVSALITDNTTIPRSVMQKVISYLQCSNIAEPINFLAKERKKLKGRGHSLYREILFLAITALGRENIDQGAFDREYTSAFGKIPEKESKLYMRCDQPLSPFALCCRQYFKPLDL